MKVVLQESEWYPILEPCTYSKAKYPSYMEVDLTQEEIDLVRKAEEDFWEVQHLLQEKWNEAYEKDELELYGPKDSQGKRWSLVRRDI